MILRRSVMKRFIFTFIVCLLVLALIPITAFADEEADVKPAITITNTGVGPNGLIIYDYYGNVRSTYLVVDFTVSGLTDDDFYYFKPDFQVTSSDASIARVNDSNCYIFSETNGTVEASVDFLKPGKTDLTFVIGEEQVTVPVVIIPYEAELISSVTIDGYESVLVKWETCPDIDGYQIQRSVPSENRYETIASFPSAVTEAVIPADTGIEYEYRVIPFIDVDDREVTLAWPDHESYEYYYTGTIIYTAPLPDTTLKSITRNGSTLTLSWEQAKGATSYEIYRSASDNGSYKKIAATGDTTTWSQTVSKGITYCYRIIPIFPDARGKASNSLSYYIPKSGKASVKELSKISWDGNNAGQYPYYGSYASSDTTYYYTSGNKKYILCLQSGKKSLKIYSLNKSNKTALFKTIILPKGYGEFGGFYHGEDGRFYVAVGRSNTKESKTRTVIQVIQYDKSWKKLKTAIIKGGAGNYYEGIFNPFSFSNASFAMRGKILYLFTARTMFIHDDGLRHQSNISFAINTDTMKAVEANESYVSHSFNQCARFKDNSLYLMDHGDAYPRAIHITVADNYDNDNKSEKGYNIFKLDGTVGANYTGCHIGGMEVSADNVITVGTSQPHKYTVGGKSGMDRSWKENLFVAVMDRETGSLSVKWLTNYKPKRTKNIISQARLIKLSDYRFAILVTINNKLHYYAIDQSGKVLTHKTYAKVPFTASSQPILKNGMLYWIESVMNTKTWKSKTKLCTIPAL